MKKNRGLAREALRFVRAAESQNYVLRHPAETPIAPDAVGALDKALKTFR